MTSVAVLGAGGVGGFVAAALDRSGAPTRVVARAETADVLRATGFAVTSRALAAQFTARPMVVTQLTEPVDILIVATKATGLAEALERAPATPGLVIRCSTGLEHLEPSCAIGSAPRAAAAAVIRIESDRPSPGMIVQTSPGARVDMADEPDGRLEEAAALFRGAGLEARTGDSEAQVMWSKLARLCALALTTSASDRPIGYVRSDARWRSALEGAVNETAAVANADGARMRRARHAG